LEAQPLIQFTSLSKTFGRGKKAVPAVVDLNLDISPGQVYGFLGRNGAGKTTTIRLLLDLIHPTQGQAALFGENVQTNHSVLSKVGSLVEDPGFYNFMNGRDNLLTLVHTSGEKPSSRVDQLLDQVGLTESASQTVSGYSKGMRQRLGIAAALLNDPELVILDEPTNGLDPNGIQEIRKFIRDLVEVEGKTVFISSHLLSEVEQVCDRVAIIHQGRIIQEGIVSQLLSGGKDHLRLSVSPVAKALEILQPTWQVKGIDQVHPDEKAWIQVEISPDFAPEIIRQLVGGGIDIHQVLEHKQSLEDLFLKVTGEEGVSDE
jgi:ABC-2 type transport system ATP-binding protein